MASLPLTLVLFSLAAVSHAGTAVHFSTFTPAGEGNPEGWTRWSARPEIMPRVFVDGRTDRGTGGSLAIQGGGNPGAYGGWERPGVAVRGGAWYRFSAWYRARNVKAENWQVVARLDWRTAAGQRAGQPDYAYLARAEGGWTRLAIDAPAPGNAAAVTLQFYLANAPDGGVWWDDISLEEIPAPGPRPVTVAAINLRPARTASPAENVRLFVEAAERTAPEKTDLIVLPEGITVVGTGKTYVEVAEGIPGPATRALGALARKKNAYVAAGIYERAGAIVYNTAVLLDRRGEVAGKYRKVYLPREEVERGLTPGGDFPVFRTDFGRVGMMICYDVFFADPARALADRGAEIVVLPIWGGNEALGKARAIESRVFLVTSGYDYPTYVMDPEGEILAQAPERGAAAVATIDLNRLYTHPHLGEMRSRRMREMRRDLAPPPPGFFPQ